MRKVLSRTAVLAAVLSLGLGACKDEGPDDEPAIAQLRLVIGAQTLTSVGNNPPGTATVIPIGTHNVTAVALASNGSTIALGTDFELRITSSNTAVINFTKTGGLTGTLAAATAGTSNLNVQLFHLGEGHSDFTIQSWPVTVN